MLQMEVPMSVSKVSSMNVPSYAERSHVWDREGCMGKGSSLLALLEGGLVGVKGLQHRWRKDEW